MLKKKSNKQKSKSPLENNKPIYKDSMVEAMLSFSYHHVNMPVSQT